MQLEGAEHLTVLLVLTTISLCRTPMRLEAAEQTPASAPRRVLFIGNSYTSQIRPCLLRMLATRSCDQSAFEFITPGGATLGQQWDNESTRERVKNGNWDFVVLQEQSQTPALPGPDGEAFQTSVDRFARLIRSVGAEPVLYMTWGRRDGDERNREIFPDYDVMQRKLSAACRDAAKRNGITLAPVGQAWSIVRTKDGALGERLYKKDGSHPSAAGAFLASCVFLRVLFDDSLESFRDQDTLQQHEVELIKTAARSATGMSQKKPDAGNGK
jgi:hypothetical protein